MKILSKLFAIMALGGLVASCNIPALSGEKDAEDDEEKTATDVEEIESSIAERGYYLAAGEITYDTDKPVSRMVIQLLNGDDLPVVGATVSVRKMSRQELEPVSASHDPEPYPDDCEVWWDEPVSGEPEPAPEEEAEDAPVPDEGLDGEGGAAALTKYDCDDHGASTGGWDPGDDMDDDDDDHGGDVGEDNVDDIEPSDGEGGPELELTKKPGQEVTGISVLNKNSNIFTIIIGGGRGYLIEAISDEYGSAVQVLEFDRAKPVDVSFPMRLWNDEDYWEDEDDWEEWDEEWEGEDDWGEEYIVDVKICSKEPGDLQELTAIILDNLDEIEGNADEKLTKEFKATECYFSIPSQSMVVIGSDATEDKKFEIYELELFEKYLVYEYAGGHDGGDDGDYEDDEEYEDKEHIRLKFCDVSSGDRAADMSDLLQIMQENMQENMWSQIASLQDDGFELKECEGNFPQVYLMFERGEEYRKVKIEHGPEIFEEYYYY